MKKSDWKIVKLSLALASLLVFFQNCADVKFKKKNLPVEQRTVQSVESPEPELYPPSIILDAQVSQQVYGEPMLFSVIADGSFPLSYQWYKSDNADGPYSLASGDGNDSPNMNIASADENDSGFYYVEVTNAQGKIQSNVISISIAIPRDMSDYCKDSGGSLEGSNKCIFNKSGSFTLKVDYLVESAKVTVVGAGGGLGTLDHSKWNAYGGAGGGAAIKTATLEAGNYSVTIGKGGNSASRWINGYKGGNGGASKFSGSGLNLNASGGQGGYQNGVTRYGRGGKRGNPANGGNGSGGDQNCKGGQGKNANYTSGTGGAGQCSGGAGGSGSSGGGASEYGGKGASGICGSGSGQHGRAGADGCVVITW